LDCEIRLSRRIYRRIFIITKMQRRSALCSIENKSDACNVDRLYDMMKKKSKKHFTVTVEGNIGSGKSTFLQYFKKSEKVEVLFEPVDMWKSVRGNNTLDLMYKDAKRWSLTFQSYVQLTMLMNHTKKHTSPVKLLERSLFSAQYCFVENLYRQGGMPDVDYAVITEWFEWIKQNVDINVDLIVYLQASPEACLERIKVRNREEESSVPLEYLESLHELHEDWLIRQSKFKLPAPVLVLDASRSLADLQKDIEKRREEILCGNV
jgi:thymidine kinase